MYLKKHSVTVSAATNTLKTNFYSSDINGRLLEVKIHNTTEDGTNALSTAGTFTVYRDTTSYAKNLIFGDAFPAGVRTWRPRGQICSTEGNAVGTTDAGASRVPWLFCDEKCNINVVSSATHANASGSATVYLYTDVGR